MKKRKQKESNKQYFLNKKILKVSARKDKQAPLEVEQSSEI